MNKKLNNIIYFISGIIITNIFQRIFFILYPSSSSSNSYPSLTSSSYSNSNSNSNSNLKKMKSCIVFGDSITQFGYSLNGQTGWVGRLSDWWQRNVDVIHRGYSGYNTKWAKEIFEEVVLNLQPNFIIIFFGANDAAIESSPQYVSLQNYEENLSFFVNQIKSKLPNTHILLITPPPIDEEKLVVFNQNKGKGVICDRFNERTSTYVEVVRKISQQLNVPMIDLFYHMNGKSTQISDRSQYLIDGIHLNELGNEKLFNLLTEKIISDFPSWNPENMKYPIEIWRIKAEKKSD